MTAAEIGNLRIAGQRIGAGKFKKPADVVAHLGAMQAQDFPMSRWAVGLRTADSTEADVLAAYNKGEIIRTHVLRPTWHIMANADVDWMLRLTGPQILGSMPGRHKQLGLTDAIFKKSNAVIEKALAAGPLVRDELVAVLKKVKLGSVDESYAHLLFNAELGRVMCSGPMRGVIPTYAAYADRVKKAPVLKRDEALYKLAERYFTGHGPATFADFFWWSGLKIADARIAYAAVEKKFSRETIGEDVYLIPKNFKPAPASHVHLLPAFDEFIIAYKDRSAVLAPGMSPKVISINGIFRPTIVANGIVRGIWKREIKKGKLAFAAKYFGKADAQLKAAVAEKVEELKKFWGLE